MITEAKPSWIQKSGLGRKSKERKQQTIKAKGKTIVPKPYKRVMRLLNIKRVLHPFPHSHLLSLLIVSLDVLSISFISLVVVNAAKNISGSIIFQWILWDSIGIPVCFSSGEKPTDDAAAVTRSGQSVFMSVYRTKVGGQCRLITITWCKNLLLHGLSISVGGTDGDSQYNCKVELKPWYFWRKQGSKGFQVDGESVDIFWDLKTAKFNGETEPQSDYYVAIVCQEEVVLLLGDQKKDAYRRTGCRPSLIEPMLVSKKEHIFGKKKFCTRAKFLEKGRFHEISVECINKNNNGGSGNLSSSICGFDSEMEIRIDGHLAIHVKHLQWKFRGNESISVNKTRVEVYWDVHDWLFSPGLRHALFVFKPTSSLSTSPSSTSTSSTSPTSSSSLTSTTAPFSTQMDGGSSGYCCLFLYAWKVE